MALSLRKSTSLGILSGMFEAFARKSARILVETSQMPSYENYFVDIVSHFQENLKIEKVDVVEHEPDMSWFHYSLGVCSLHWRLYSLPLGR